MSLDRNRPSLRAELSTQACDICRRRKVKCRPSQAAEKCGRCERLGLQCTFLSPSNPRGPKKRIRPSASPEAHASNAVAAGDLDSASVTTSPSYFKYPTDHICDRGLFKTILEDYLDELYPLIPIVHHPSFRQSLQEDRDCEDRGFLSLIIGIAAVVVATMPSKYELYRSHSPPLKFGSRREMVRYCHDTIFGLRTSTYFDEVNFQKFATSYLFYAAFLQLGDHNRARMSDIETMQIARLLNLHRISEYKDLNCIETQLRKKGFWLVFYSFVHMQLQSMFGERLSYLDPVILQSIDPEDLMPLEVDDEFISETEVLMPASPTPCMVTGFILHSRVFWAALRSPCSTKVVEEPCPCVRAHNTNLQISYLQNRLHNLKYLLNEIPPVLRPWGTMDERVLDHDSASASDAAKRSSNFESMRANLHVTHLWLQSLLIDQLEAAQACQQGLPSASSPHDIVPDRRILWLDREELCRQLFFVLHSLPPKNLEANGLHLTYKVRDIASGLLECPFHPDDPEAKRAAEYVQHSSGLLSRLDRSESVNTMHLQSWVDTDRLPK